MPDAETMRALIERVEKATGADRELDAEIARLLLPKDAEDVVRSYRHWVYRVFTPDGWEGEELEIQPYTGSLDAAVSLVPRGLFWMIALGKTRPDEPPGGAQLFNPASLALAAEGEAATPALALVAAALRARLAGEVGDG